MGSASESHDKCLTLEIQFVFALEGGTHNGNTLKSETGDSKHFISPPHCKVGKRPGGLRIIEYITDRTVVWHTVTPNVVVFNERLSVDVL